MSPPRARLWRTGLAILLLVATTAPLAWGTTGGWALVVALALALPAAALRLFAPSEARGLVAFALGAGSLVVAGQEKIGWPYGLAAVAFVALTLASSAAALPPTRLDRRGRALALVVLGVAGSVGGTGAFVLPRLEGALQRALGRIFLDEDTAATGFSDRMRLGSMRDMLQNGDVALRVFGAPTDYLRGVVYDRYDEGRWLATMRQPPRPVASRPEAPGDVILEQRSGRPYFLPLGACAIGSRDGPLVADGAGIVTPGTGARAARAWFDPRCHEAAVPVPAPHDVDLQVPDDVRPAVERALSRWTVAASAPLDRAVAIERHLRTEYRYSLDSERDARLDPVVDFLERHREGHCEYFASAMVLVARSAGLPARVVGGYRVGEENSLGGWWVVRERNAHAWVEVWIDDRWRTFDPTPQAALDAPRRDGLLLGLVDVTSRAWERATARQLMELATVIALGLASWLAARRLLRGRAPEVRPGDKGPPPPPTFERLERALARLGHERLAWEPIEAFAARVAETPSGQPAADLLRRYARHRYGGEGDLARLVDDVDRFATAVRARA